MAEKQLAELKARCADLAAVRARLEPSARHEATLPQRDTYFVVRHGRLKLRETTGGPAQLIFYERPDVATVKPSRIRLAEIADGPALRALLESALGVRARVVKRREIWWWQGVQVHLDTVDGLGTFLEFEATIEDAPAALARAEEHLRRLLAKLDVPLTALVAGSYADLLGWLTGEPGQPLA